MCAPVAGDQDGEGLYGFGFFLGRHGDRFYSGDAYIGYGGGCAATAISGTWGCGRSYVRVVAAICCGVFIIPVSGGIACGVGSHIPPELIPLIRAMVIMRVIGYGSFPD
jgi:hypothetical protein